MNAQLRRPMALIAGVIAALAICCGLMGAARAGLLRDVESMLRFAMLAEETSASKYREFASLAASPGARETLERIASEEDRHLSELRTQG